MYSGLSFPDKGSTRITADSTAIVRCGDHGDAGGYNGACRHCGSDKVLHLTNHNLAAALDKIDGTYAEAVRWARYRCQQGGMTSAEWEFCKMIHALAFQAAQERNTIENGRFA